MRRHQRGFLFLPANTPWVYALARHLVPAADVTVVRFIDWLNNARLKPSWPETQTRMRRRVISMPPGYAGSFERLARPLMRSMIDSERRRLCSASGEEPYVVCIYPYLAPWVRHVSGNNLVYYNLDDYTLYNVRRSKRTEALEDELIERATLTVCLSAHQVAKFQARHPGRASSIRHFPLGVHESFLNPNPTSPVEANTVGYIGNMTERVDWGFVHEVAQAMPDVRFPLVGNARDGASGAHTAYDPAWSDRRNATLRLPNVVVQGSVPQSQVHLHYWRYAVNWMPYDATHPFNIASCPTKLMDALASGRPFVSTDIPEARQYPDHVHVVREAQEAVERIRSLLDGARSHDAAAQMAFAKRQTWDHRAAELLQMLR